ncbi:hypothetical protein FZEAL_8884 [Fusarium zealandicum]|uniref:RNA polymerase Rpb4/RPC9 core domain-containing protein n=1 Tax=Fusarium zealandicum TaxID=1053134 RepID=A0A8H4UD03_9HYPO|nr:hypothetical protein FZEAL_8884 [Fusarium zealandicum]
MQPVNSLQQHHFIFSLRPAQPIARPLSTLTRPANSTRSRLCPTLPLRSRSANSPTMEEVQVPKPKKVNHPRTSRPKPAPPGNEEASATLNLGEFQEVDTLTLSEAALVLNALVAKRRNDNKGVAEKVMLHDTLNYLDNFARFTQKENVEAVERLLSAHKSLAKFERAQLGSLCCENADEAKTLIPSLADKIKDDDLQDLLDEISKLQNR